MIYMMRSILREPKTLKELSDELGLAFITVNKLVAELSEKNIVKKFTIVEKHTNGRPHIYICLNPDYFCALISIIDDNYVVKLISPYSEFEKKEYFRMPIRQYANDPTETLHMVRAYIGQDHPYCLGMYLIKNESIKIGNVRKIQKFELHELLVESFADNDKVIYIECFDKRILINHGNARFVEITKEQLHSTLLVDEEYIVTENNLNLILTLALRRMCEKKLEEKI